jgi:hypothetical protein
LRILPPLVLETVLHIPDGKPKMKDMPKEMGGSGVTLPD